MSTLRDQVTVIEKTRQTGTNRGKVRVTEGDTHWCNVRVVSASRQVVYQQAGMSDVTHEIRISCQAESGLTMKGTKFKWINTGQYLEVVAPPADLTGRGRWLWMPVKELAVSAI